MTTIPEMTASTELLAAESAALADFLAGLDAAGWARASACADWTVADVAAHLAQGSAGAALALTRAQAGDPSPPEGQRLLDAGERASAMTAERAIAYRSNLAPSDLLQAFNDGLARLGQAAGQLQAADWEKPSFHRRGIIPVHENIARRIQEIAIHGWDIRSAFDPAAELSDPAAAMIMSLTHRWLTASFTPIAGAAPSRFRFEVSGAAARRQDVVLTGDAFAIEEAAAAPADVTFRGNGSAYVLLTYGRLDISGGAPATAQLEIDGPLEKALLFTTAFAGY